MDRGDAKQRFSIRKYKLGAASVLLATVFANGTTSVSADEQIGTTESTANVSLDSAIEENSIEESASETYVGPAVLESTSPQETVEVKSSSEAADLKPSSEAADLKSSSEATDLKPEMGESSVEKSKSAETNQSISSIPEVVVRETEVSHSTVVESENKSMENPKVSESAPKFESVFETKKETVTHPIVKEENVAEVTATDAENMALVQDLERKSEKAEQASRFRSVLRSTGAREGEVRIFQLFRQIQTTSGDAADYGARVISFDGYVSENGPEPDGTYLVRWVAKYVPNRVSGRAPAAPVGVSIAGTATYEVPKTVLFNGQTITGVPSKTDSTTKYYSPSVKANIGQENTLEFTSKVTPWPDRDDFWGHFVIDFATAFSPTYNKPVDPANRTTPIRNIISATVTLDGTAFKKYKNRDRTVTEEIPFSTEYQADDSQDVGKELVVREGVNGEQTVKITTSKNAQGETVETRGEPVVVREPVSKQVKVGTKPKVETTNLPFKTVYQNDPTMKTDAPEVVVTEGKEGRKVVTTTYSVNSTTGEVTANTPTEEVTDAVDRVIKRGTKPADKDTYEPVGKEQTVRPGGTPRATLAIGNLADLPEGTQVGFKSPVDTATEGNKSAVVVVTYPDKSSEEVPVIVKVVAPDADKYTPAGKTQTVKPNETPQAVNSIENASSLPEGTQYAFKAPVNTS
uniref:Rib/alpha-like domain-containing protein n=1 Tax=Streptococcus danieliae TaxID=747656 RepID=UPI0026F27D8E